MLTRRRLLHFGTTAGAAVGFPVWLRSGAGVNTVGQGSAFTDVVPDAFPAQPAALAREIVSVSHFNPARVRELVEARPALARAAYDWGFGDWEDALGACSHTGQREIAEYLISKGARPTIFSAAMLGQLDVVKAFVAASPGVQRTSGPHSIRLLAHARAGGARAKGVLDYLEGLGDADARPTLTPLDEKTITLLSGTYTFGPGPTRSPRGRADPDLADGAAASAWRGARYPEDGRRQATAVLRRQRRVLSGGSRSRADHLCSGGGQRPGDAAHGSRPRARPHRSPQDVGRVRWTRHCEPGPKGPGLHTPTSIQTAL